MGLLGACMRRWICWKSDRLYSIQQVTDLHTLCVLIMPSPSMRSRGPYKNARHQRAFGTSFLGVDIDFVKYKRFANHENVASLRVIKVSSIVTTPLVCLLICK